MQNPGDEGMKILITAQGDFVAQRFDLTAEVVLVTVDNGELVGKPRTIIMDRPSPEDLSNMIMEENISVVICGGIEDRHYQFLTWKKIRVIDYIIGDHETALRRFLAGELQPGDLLPLTRGDLSL
jgi:predicted Fe-Mo cluster-binding NifX family protein